MNYTGRYCIMFNKVSLFDDIKRSRSNVFFIPLFQAECLLMMLDVPQDPHF